MKARKSTNATAGDFLLLALILLGFAALWMNRSHLVSDLTQHALAGTTSQINVSSRDELESAIASAKTIESESYLYPEWLVQSLEHACRTGTMSAIVLAQPDYDPQISSENTADAHDLTIAGCGATTVSTPLHLKSVIVNAHDAWLSDTNFSSAGYLLHIANPTDIDLLRNAVMLRTGSNATFATDKGDALNLEVRVILAANHTPVCVSTESFGESPIADVLANHIGPTDLIVAAREAQNSSSERALLDQLTARGVRIRLSNADEKIAAGPQWVFFGSANATSGLPAQVDWGLATSDPVLVHYARTRCENDFADARMETP